MSIIKYLLLNLYFWVFIPFCFYSKYILDSYIFGMALFLICIGIFYSLLRKSIFIFFTCLPLFSFVMISMKIDLINISMVPNIILFSLIGAAICGVLMYVLYYLLENKKRIQ